MEGVEGGGEEGLRGFHGMLTYEQTLHCRLCGAPTRVDGVPGTIHRYSNGLILVRILSEMLLSITSIVKDRKSIENVSEIF